MKKLASALALILTLAACVTVDTTATSTTPPTTPGSTLAAPTTEATDALPSTTTAAPEPTTTDPPGFPPERESLQHGAETWAVVLAGSDDVNDPALTEAIQAAEDAGYVTGPTDCDEGAEAALDMPDGTLTVSVYLETEADARAALLAFEERGVTGVVAQVRTFCLD
ncbi:MAG TPA: hypothetical protein VK990_10355 [Acidimicrobiia bacterium]|nr:hypothetical protein [Acidimicrobiia bacterium]